MWLENGDLLCASPAKCDKDRTNGLKPHPGEAFGQGKENCLSLQAWRACDQRPSEETAPDIPHVETKEAHPGCCHSLEQHLLHDLEAGRASSSCLSCAE